MMINQKTLAAMKHFKRTELIRCYYESKEQRCKGCRLTSAVKHAPNCVDVNIEALVENVLDPAREQLGRPIYVTSGFRCPFYNDVVGGVKNSQHILGEAADIYIGSPEENLKLARIIAEQGAFDQMILYVNSASSLAPRFIHVTYKRPSKGSGANPCP